VIDCEHCGKVTFHNRGCPRLIERGVDSVVEKLPCIICSGFKVFREGIRYHHHNDDTCSCNTPLPDTESDRKDTNPKDAVGIAKAPISVVSAVVVAELGLAMFEGARKYGRHNWRAAKARASVYYDAAWRHLATLSLRRSVSSTTQIKAPSNSPLNPC